MSTTIPLKIALTADRPVGLPLPTYAKPGDAGLDLVAIEPATLGTSAPLGDMATMLGGRMPPTRALIRTGLRLEIPPGHVGLICPRSGMAAKHGVVACLGVIDGPYRGEIKVNLINHGADAYEVQRGDKIAQLLLLPIASAVIEVVDALTPSERGEGGFGHTGQ